jgi:glucosylglycerate phosphorylase
MPQELSRPFHVQRSDYRDDPDFSAAPLQIPAARQQRLLDRLRVLYGPEIAAETLPEMLRLMKVHHAHKTGSLLEAERAVQPSERFTECDVMLITYGDSVQAENQSGLAALKSFVEAIAVRDRLFSILHILPFFPYTSDRGFSVTDFRVVDGRIGTWEELEELSRSFRLMFDGVFNHASSKSKPFQEMLSGNPEYKDFAVCFRSAEDMTREQRKLLRRPRTSDVLTQFLSIDGPLWVWTTFSPDQIDLNFKNPKVLLNVTETLLFYVRKGADLVRLDAVTYLWDELGTTGANLAQTHEIVKLFRDVLDIAAPEVALVTETNVPHDENVSYFGNGSDEAQMVYNFALPPLVLHAFYRGDATWLSRWASQLEFPSETTTYLNMLDTHDGIGLPGATTILPPDEITFLTESARLHGAFISYRSTAEGEVPYEINTTWYSALNLENTGESRELQVQRFLASRSIALALRGVPGIYIHSLAGTRNDVRLALESKVKRDVNRTALNLDLLKANLADPRSKLRMILEGMSRLLATRSLRAAFHPNGEQRVVMLSPQVFALLRTSPEADEHVLCMTNVSNTDCCFEVATSELGIECVFWYDLFAGRGWTATNGILSVQLKPYEIAWLTPFRELERAIEGRR